MYKIKTYNNISKVGLAKFPQDRYQISGDFNEYDAVIVRSASLHELDFPTSLLAVARAGAGVNNIPVTKLTEMGLPVFNAPGANANAVKELVVTGLLLSCRGTLEGIDWVKSLKETTNKKEFTKVVEKEKKRFRGSELKGKTLGVVGLGGIGSMVADVGLTFGMNVLGYDPLLSVDAAWRLSNQIKKTEDLKALLSQSDYVTLHLPVTDSTRKMVGKELFDSFKMGSVLLNFSRGEIVDSTALLEALENCRLARYVTDFPEPSLMAKKNVICTPHIGASTMEAEDNCAIMASQQLYDFIENGNIVNSVNFPNAVSERREGTRITVTSVNNPKALGSILAKFTENNIELLDLTSKSKEQIAYNIIDLGTKPNDDLLASLRGIEGIVKVRVI